MNSKYLFTNYDLLDYEKASKKVIIYLNNMLNIYCHNKKIGWMMADRIKSLDSINDKIKKKRLEKGNDFDYRLDLLDIAGLRVIFYDRDTIIPYGDDSCGDFFENLNPIDSLNKEIHSWNPEQFKEEFDKSKLNQENYNVSNLYDFVEFLMRECKRIVVVKDYIMYQKESGYQSIHVIITVPIESFNGSLRKVPVEIQFRNFTQHLYNECEHARYKNVYKDMSGYTDVFNEAKRYLLTVANDAYTDILSEKNEKNRSYFLIRKF